MEKEIVTKNNNDKSVREIEVNLAPLLSALLKKLWLIILGAIVGALLFYTVSVILIKPTYRSSFTAFVNNQTQSQIQKNAVSSADLQASRELVQTYSRILTSNNMLKAALEFDPQLDIDYDDFSAYVTTEVEDKTQIIKVNVTSKDSNGSYNIANAIANAAPDYMKTVVEGSSMKIVDDPKPPKAKFGPNYFSYGLLGFVIGLLLTLIYVLVKYFRDDTIKSEGDLEGRYNLPVVGIIPNLNETKGMDYASYDYYYYKTPEDKKTNKKKGGKK